VFDRPSRDAVRTFPRELAAFQEIAKQRAVALQHSSFEKLEALASEPVEHLSVEGRPATIGLLVERVDANRLRVVVQGFMEHRFFPGRSVALDGFYKSLDGTVAPMSYRELYQYD